MPDLGRPRRRDRPHRPRPAAGRRARLHRRAADEPRRDRRPRPRARGLVPRRVPAVRDQRRHAPRPRAPRAGGLHVPHSGRPARDGRPRPSADRAARVRRQRAARGPGDRRHRRAPPRRAGERDRGGGAAGGSADERRGAGRAARRRRVPRPRGRRAARPGGGRGAVERGRARRGARGGARRARRGLARVRVLSVVKVGGGLAREAGDGALRALGEEIARCGERHPLLVVPGGGAFADAVRAHDRRYGLRDETAHWMAILAMDQFGRALADLIPDARLRDDLAPVRAGAVTVILPYALLRERDPLPASWDVTSDSIAAWVAGAAGAGRLVLVKAVASADPADVVDPYLPTALRDAGVEAWVLGPRP